MTEVSERTVSLCSPMLYAVLQRSSWPLLPGTRPPTRRQKPPFTSSFPSSWASPTWARYAPDFFRSTLWRLSVARSPRLPRPADAQNPRRSRPQHLVVWIRRTPQSTSSSDQVNSQDLSVFPSPGFLHTNRMHVLPVAPTVYQPFSPGPPCIGHKETNPPFVLPEIHSIKSWNHFASSVTILPGITACVDGQFHCASTGEFH